MKIITAIFLNRLLTEDLPGGKFKLTATWSHGSSARRLQFSDPTDAVPTA